MKLWDRIEKLLRKCQFTDKLISQYNFRTVVFSLCSFTLNTAYGVFNGVIAALNMSVWYGALAAYYIILAVMRGGILRYHNRKRKGAALKYGEKEYGVVLYRRCGIWLIVLNVCLPAAIVQMVVVNNPFSHTGLMIYASALYAFVKISLAVYNMFKANKNDDMTVRALRSINFADASVSILALQIAMLKEFSPDWNGSLANSLTGAAVCILTVALGIYMVVTANRARAALRSDCSGSVTE